MLSSHVDERCVTSISLTSISCTMSSGMASPRGISVAQLCLAWLLERGIRPVIGASSKAHIEEALLTPQVALPLALSEQEAAIIRALDRDVHAGFNPNDIP